MLAVLATRVVNGRVCPRIRLSLFIAFILPGGLLLLPNTYYYCIVVPAVCLDCTTGVRPIVNRCADTSKVFQVGAILQPTRPKSSFNPSEQKKSAAAEFIRSLSRRLLHANYSREEARDFYSGLDVQYFCVVDVPYHPPKRTFLFHAASNQFVYTRRSVLRIS